MSDNIVNKIRAILARAEEGRGATDEERDTAMQMAQKLLFKHNLSMADVGDIDHDAGRDFVREHENLETWSGHLLYRISKVFFCTVYYWTGSGSTRRYFIVGRADQVKVVRELHAYIARQIEMTATAEVVKRGQCPRYALVAVRKYAFEQGISEEQALREMQESGLKGDAGLEMIMDLTGLTKSYAGEVRPFIKRGNIAPEIVDDLGVWRRSFLEAATNKVYLRLHDTHRAQVKEAGTKGTDLVRDEKAALNAYLESIGLSLSKGSSSERKRDLSGAAAGSDAGAGVDITLGNKVGAGGTRLLGS